MSSSVAHQSVLNPLSAFFRTIITSTWHFLIFSLCSTFYLVHTLFSQVHQAFYYHYLRVRLMVYLFHLVLFLKLCLILLIKVYFSISLFCLVLCVCFYLLGKSATQNHPFLKDLACLGGKEGFSMQSPHRQNQALQGHPQRCAVSFQRGCQCHSIRLGRGDP